MGAAFCRRNKDGDRFSYHACGSVNLGKLITMAKGGDIILIQDQAYIDNYTMMNSQEAHYMKHFLRFKFKENP